MTTIPVRVAVLDYIKCSVYTWNRLWVKMIFECSLKWSDPTNALCVQFGVIKNGGKKALMFCKKNEKCWEKLWHVFTMSYLCLHPGFVCVIRAQISVSSASHLIFISSLYFVHRYFYLKCHDLALWRPNSYLSWWFAHESVYCNKKP